MSQDQAGENSIDGKPILLEQSGSVQQSATPPIPYADHDIRAKPTACSSSGLSTSTEEECKERPQSGGPFYIPKKIYSVLGTDVAPDKARQLLGSMDPQAMLKAKEQDMKDYIKEREEILRRRPNEQQKAIPQGTPIPVAVKALDILGSEELREKSMKAIPNFEQVKNNRKLVKTLGELGLADDKAQKILGRDGASEAFKAVKLADEQLKKERDLYNQQQIQMVLKSKPSREQLEIPTSPTGKGKDHVASKALGVFGDATLEAASREVIHNDQVKQNAKVVKVFGDEKLFPDKAADKIGAISEDSNARKLADEQLESELSAHAERLRREHIKQTEEVLKRTPNPDQLRLPSGLSAVPDKAVEVMGDEHLAQQVREHIPTEATIQPKAISVLGESRIAGIPVEGRLGSSDNDPEAVRKADKAFVAERSKSREEK